MQTGGGSTFEGQSRDTSDYRASLTLAEERGRWAKDIGYEVLPKEVLARLLRLLITTYLPLILCYKNSLV